MNNIYDCLIIGAGPCGYGASEVFKEKNIKYALIERNAPGGKVNVAPRVDNYPGYEKISGPDLAFEFYKKFKENKAEIINDNIISLTKKDNLFILKGEKEIYYSSTVLVATGTIEKKLGLDKEKEFLGHGISYCAVCDGHFYKNQNVLVAGGGNSALKEAIHLSDIVQTLYLIHRRDEFRGEKQLVEELKSHPNVIIKTPYVPIQIIGESKVEGVIIENVNTKEKEILKVEGFFPLVGQLPNSQFINIDGVLDKYGFIPTNKDHSTGISGLYAGGDILPRDLRQIYLSKREGEISALSIVSFLHK